MYCVGILLTRCHIPISTVEYTTQWLQRDNNALCIHCEEEEMVQTHFLRCTLFVLWCRNPTFMRAWALRQSFLRLGSEKSKFRSHEVVVCGFRRCKKSEEFKRLSMFIIFSLVIILDNSKINYSGFFLNHTFFFPIIIINNHGHGFLNWLFLAEHFCKSDEDNS